MMQPISALASAAARKVMCVLTDIDDTLTTQGRLPAAAYTARETLHNAGLKVVPLACGVAKAKGLSKLSSGCWRRVGVRAHRGEINYRIFPVWPSE